MKASFGCGIVLSQESERDLKKMKASVLIGAPSSVVGDLLAQALSASPYLEVAVSVPAGDGPSVLAEARRNPPDILLLDSDLARMDGISVLKEMRRGGERATAVVFLAYPDSESYNAAETVGADCVIAKPFHPEMLVERLENIFLQHCCFAPACNTVSRSFCEVSAMLQRAGIPAHLKGYQYLREGIRCVSLDPELINAVTKRLYPRIAYAYSTTSQRVERAMRHAIGIGWERGETGFLRQLLGYGNDGDRGKPTNSEFIAATAERLNMNGRMVR